MDGGCEQEHEFEIVRCSGHQHVGSRCITLFNAENGEQICKSCPVYGTVEGECLILNISAIPASCVHAYARSSQLPEADTRGLKGSSVTCQDPCHCTAMLYMYRRAQSVSCCFWKAAHQTTIIRNL